MAVVFSVGIVIALLLLIPLYFYLTRHLAREEKVRVLALVMLIPAMAVALLTNQEIFNAYLVWADQHFQLTFFGTDLADQLDDHPRRDAELLDAGCRRRLLQMVRHRAR